MAVIKFAVHPIKLDLCSGSTDVYLLGSKSDWRLLVEDIAVRSWLLLPSKNSGLDARRGARKGDFGGRMEGLDDDWKNGMVLSLDAYCLRFGDSPPLVMGYDNIIK